MEIGNKHACKIWVFLLVFLQKKKLIPTIFEIFNTSRICYFLKINIVETKETIFQRF